MTDLKLAFYSYFYENNNESEFKIPKVPSLTYNCYFYSNNETIIDTLKETQWIGVYDDKPCNKDLIESCMLGKHVKAMPHEYTELKDYDYLCFVDSEMDKVNEKLIEDYINEYFIEQNYALLPKQHWFVGANIHDEFITSMNKEKYRIEHQKYNEYINKQITNGLSEKTTHHYNTKLLIRNMKHEKMNEINTTWYNHIQECGIQDNISFFFAKQLFDDYIFPFVNNHNILDTHDK
jgi:hypothetical protein